MLLCLLLLGVLLLRLGLLLLTLLLGGVVGMVLLLDLPLLLRVGGSHYEQQRQNGGAGDSDCFHGCYLQLRFIKSSRAVVPLH